MIALGSDHGGYGLKQEIIHYLEAEKISYRDYGCDSLESCDYPIYGHEVGRRVASGECTQGIVICTSGIGISIAANKIEGIRCALCVDSHMAEMSRRHNDANVLALGAGMVDKGTAQTIVKTFLETAFEGGRHQRRVSQIEEEISRLL